MTILQAAYHEVALANSRLRTENDIMRACLAQLEAEIAELRAKLAAYTDELDVAEFHLHSLVDDEHAGGVMHGDIEGTFQRLRNFLTKQEEG